MTTTFPFDALGRLLKVGDCVEMLDGEICPIYAIDGDHIYFYGVTGQIAAFRRAGVHQVIEEKRSGVKDRPELAKLAEQALRLRQTRHICVADRESDIMALLVRARELDHAADYLVRSQHNRALPEGGKLWEKAGRAPVLGHVRFDLPAGRGRKTRSVKQELRVERVTLKDGAKGQVRCGDVMNYESLNNYGQIDKIPSTDLSERHYRITVLFLCPVHPVLARATFEG